MRDVWREMHCMHFPLNARHYIGVGDEIDVRCLQKTHVSTGMAPTPCMVTIQNLIFVIPRLRDDGDCVCI